MWKSRAVNLVCAAVVLHEREAAACGTTTDDPCAEVPHWAWLSLINPVAIPADGALLFEALPFTEHALQDHPERLVVEVTRNGVVVSGEVEAAGVDNVVAWRPSWPLQFGDYKVTATLDNGGCGDEPPLEWNFVVDGGSSPLPRPKLDVFEQVWSSPPFTLDSLVCCDGAVPEVAPDEDDCTSTTIDWSAGYCAWAELLGKLQVQITVDPGVYGPTWSQLRYTLFVDGVAAVESLDYQLVYAAPNSYCTKVRVTNIGTHQWVESPQQCHDGGLYVGRFPSGLTADLLGLCTSPLQKCAVNPSGDAWDPQNCTPWPGDDDPTGADGTTGDGTNAAADEDLSGRGCDCRSHGRGSAWSPLAAIAFVGLVRRRRGRWVERQI